MAARRLTTLPLACLVVLGLAACPEGTSETDGGDGGEQEPTCDAATVADEVSVLPGHTDQAYRAIEDGDTIPSWPRPQGGIGTRINVAMWGVELPETDSWASLTTLMLGVVDDPSDTPGEEGAACIGTGEDATCNGEDLECIDDVCRFLISDQVNRRFPVECLDGGLVLVPEMPVRYENQLSLNDLDGREVELTSILEPNDESGVFRGTVNVVLEVGEFVEPSWWEN